jgi:hypothetical protein
MEVQQYQQPDRYEAICKDRQKVVRSIISLTQRLDDVSVCRPDHEEGPSKSGCKPKRATDPDAQESQEAPSPIVKSDLKLERASWRPADALRCLIGKKDVRNEPED